MWCELTSAENGFVLPVRRVFRRNETVELDGRRYRLSQLTPAQRLAAGYAEFSDQNFDSSAFKSAGSNDALDTGSGVVTRVHTLAYLDIGTLKNRKFRQIADHRYGVETGSIDVAGKAIFTNRESLALISGAYQLVQRNAAAQVQWKGISEWFIAGKAEIDAIFDAVTVPECILTSSVSCLSKAWGLIPK